MSLIFTFSFCMFSMIFDFFLGLFSFLIFFIYFILNWGGFVFSGTFFLDGISFFLIFLSSLVFLGCSFSSFLDKWGMNNFSYFLFYLLGIFFFLFVSFSCFNFILFYISFEFVFILMFLFVLNWGYSPERLMASFYMVFYTLVVSFPFLIYLVLSSPILEKFCLWGVSSSYWWLCFFLVFLVKLPVYGVHLWLPKAHVEAPVSGSMVLAGVLLKLGAYGFLRFSSFVLSYLTYYLGYFCSIGLIGGLYSCFLCLRQSDLKSFVAYSSVCHMGFGLAGLFSGSLLGVAGGFFMMIAHGFCSSCLFYILYVIYERFFSRSSFVVKGVGYLFPLMSLVWFVFSVLNMGVPPSFSFLSEVSILVGVGGFNLYLFMLVGLCLFFSGVYGIFLFVISCHGTSFLFGNNFSLSPREYLNFFVHFFFLIFIIFSLDYFFF